MYRESSKGWFKHSDFVLVDLISMQIAFVFAYFIRYGIINPYKSTMYRNQALVLLLCQFIFLIAFNGFKNVLKRGLYAEFLNIVKHGCLAMAASLLFLYLTRLAYIYSRFVFLMTGVLYIFISFIFRILWKKVVVKNKRESNKKCSMIIVTKSDMVKSVIERLSSNGYSDYAITGLILMDRDLVGKKFEGVSVIGKADDLTGYICHEWVDEVFVCLPNNENLTNEQMREFLRMGVTIHSVIELPDGVGAKRQCIERISNFTVHTISTNIVTEKMMFCKRCVDIASGLMGCLLTGILFVFIAPAIYIKSPGPIFFSQWRVGKNGRKFKIYKFRSMYLDAEERKEELMKENKIKDGMMFKLDYDPRIIGSEKHGKDGKPKGIGNFIRKTSIDEFPQFFNVLKGDMSLVGTRPPTLDEWEKYEPHHRARMAIKPGITGAWQVSGRSDITDFEEVVKLDTEYIENWTNGLDIKIILKTVKSVIKREGAS